MKRQKDEEPEGRSAAKTAYVKACARGEEGSMSCVSRGRQTSDMASMLLAELPRKTSAFGADAVRGSRYGEGTAGLRLR